MPPPARFARRGTVQADRPPTHPEPEIPMPTYKIGDQYIEAPNYLEARRIADGQVASRPAVTTAAKAEAPKSAPLAKLQQPPRQMKPPVVLKRAEVAPKELPEPLPVLRADPHPDGAAAPFELVCYRGEKSNWWSPPEQRLVCGMTLYQPWNLLPGVKTMTDLWEYMVKTMFETSFGKVDGFAQHLRASGRPYALATARSTTGAYTSDFNYKIVVPGARTFRWRRAGGTLKLGAAVDFSKEASVDDHYVVLNADTLAESTILAVGHKCGTYEVTFMHDLPIQYIHSCNGKLISEYAIKDPKTLDFEDKIALRKYLR